MDKWERRQQKTQNKGKTKLRRQSNLKNLKVGIDVRIRKDLERFENV